MRQVGTVLNNIPIRYFVPLGFLVAAGITALIYVFVALPEAEQKAYDLTEKTFHRTISDMQGRYNTLLSQGNQFSVSQDIFITADDPAVLALAILSEDSTVRFAYNSALRGKPYTALRHDVDERQIKRAMATGQIIEVRNAKQKTITGYAGLGYVEGRTMTKNALVYVQSTADLASEIQNASLHLVTFMGLTLFALAGLVLILTWVKIDRRLKKLLLASRKLASEQGDINFDVGGSDEFGQLADQLKITARILALKQARANEAMLKAQEASAVKSEFLSNMSHEIRTPMNGVISGLNLLMSSKSEEEKNELMGASLSSAHALLNIINDILDFSKLEAGKLSVHPAPFLLARMLRDIHILMRPVAAEKRNTLALELADDCDACILADEVRLRQVINNLVSNALKFTEGGTITVSVQLKKNELEQQLEVRVTDTGSGISEEDLERLFRRFSQLKNAMERRAGGTGLGLAISQQLVQLMGGQIGVESALGEGSTFWFRIPVEIQDTYEVRNPDHELLEDHGRSVKILLAEDVVINQMLITKMLKTLGHDVTLAEDGEKALALLGGEKAFDLILMDNQMPNLTGMEATKAIRERGDETAKIPIIALTADAMMEQRDAFFSAGVNGFVSKPIEIDKLRFEIARVLQETN
ncbi:ATP-binding protein [Kordiimonas aestuarii]|uniref:ATP-binding protein n=1 Tax=Kordiimonas aestuarii TaxID=1005925 RepID=UPI0021CEA141|nr:ATP-binding protein [Kordiimonas aestuarii]